MTDAGRTLGCGMLADWVTVLVATETAAEAGRTAAELEDEEEATDGLLLGAAELEAGRTAAELLVVTVDVAKTATAEDSAASFFLQTFLETVAVSVANAVAVFTTAACCSTVAVAVAVAVAYAVAVFTTAACCPTTAVAVAVSVA